MNNHKKTLARKMIKMFNLEQARAVVDIQVSIKRRNMVQMSDFERESEMRPTLNINKKRKAAWFSLCIKLAHNRF